MNFLPSGPYAHLLARPTPLAAAHGQIEAWFESPSLVLLAETQGYWPSFARSLVQGRILAVPQVHDAASRRSAAIMAFAIVDFRSRL